jgi:hypothetical protein
MKKTLYEIELSYSINLNDKQRKLLDKYTKTILKKEEDFEINKYHDEYETTTKESWMENNCLLYTTRRKKTGLYFR